MTGVYLVFRGSVSSPSNSLAVCTTAQECYDRIGEAEGRISPIFPVIPKGAPRNPLEAAAFVALLCPLRAFEFVGRQPEDVQRKIWFSLGIAAVIIFAKNEKEYAEIIQREVDHLSAYEIWRISEDQTVAIHQSWVRAVSFDPPRLKYSPELTKDTLRLIDEIQGNLHEAARVAAVFMPEETVKFQRLAAAANEIIRELEFLENPSGSEPPKQFATRGEALTSDKFGIHQRVNQRMTQLIQLNSALAYVVSQTSHGSVPILEGPCLIATHSLLGVATAYRALSALVAFVERSFEQIPILSIVDRGYRAERGVNVFTDTVRYERDQWRDAGVSLDNLVGKAEIESNRPKIVYFSSRLGFAETHFSVTSASQALHAGDSVRWSLMTLTHELLHAHVTGLLATVFGQDITQGLTWESFVKLHDEFRDFTSRHVSAPETMLSSLRYMVFAFAVSRYGVAKKLNEIEHQGADKASSRVQLLAKLPDQTDLFTAFYRSSLRLLEEILVHTLDLHYFYSGNADTYLELLWLSWTTVPAVVGDLETYLLRSLAAIATMENGSVAQRFGLVREHLLAKLSRLIAADGTNIFLQKAREHLNDPAKTRRLRLLFFPAVYAADMTAFFLRSRSLQAELWSKDENVEPSGEGEFLYSMETGEFSGNCVSNPLAFIADRLRRSEDYGDLDEDFRSAWILIAAASAA